MYGTVEDANVWLGERGLPPVTESALIAASDWIDAVYGGRFVGVPTGAGAWPRDDAVDCWGRPIVGTPEAVLHAAWLAAGNGLGIGVGGITYIRGARTITEGGLSVTWANESGGAAGAGLTGDPMIDALLGCYLRKGIPVRLV